MIDTVKFRIPITKDDFKVLLDKSNVHMGYTYASKQAQYVIIKVPINLGSFVSRKVLRIPKNFMDGYENYAELELSIPKYCFRHNVKMLKIADFYPACENIAKDLEEELGLKSDVNNWLIQRLDICYNWKLDSRKQLDSYLKIFQNLDYSRKKKYIYDTSAMYKGSTYTVKIYSKYDEYLVHDYPHLCKWYPTDWAMEALEQSKNVLRFEVSIRKQHLDIDFHKANLKIIDVTEELVIKALNKYFLKLVKLTNTELATTDSAFSVLTDKYGMVKGRDIFEKLRLWLSDDPTDRKIFMSYSYPNRYKFFKALKKADVGFTKGMEEKFEFRLTIPSDLAVFGELSVRKHAVPELPAVNGSPIDSTSLV